MNPKQKKLEKPRLVQYVKQMRRMEVLIESLTERVLLLELLTNVRETPDTVTTRLLFDPTPNHMTAYAHDPINHPIT